MNIIVVTVLALAGFLILTSGSYLLFILANKAKRFGGRAKHFKAQLMRLRQDFLILSKSINIFRELTSQYFETISSNGFTNLCKIESALASAIDKCDEALSEGNQKPAEQIINYLYVKRGSADMPNCLHSLLGDEAEHLDNWAEKAKKLLIQISESVDQSSNALKEIGSEARRKRKSTVLMLDEARLAIELFQN